MIYTVNWDDNDDDYYHVELSTKQKDELEKRMKASDEIERFTILDIGPSVNSYEDFIDMMEDLELL